MAAARPRPKRRTGDQLSKLSDQLAALAGAKCIARRHRYLMVVQRVRRQGGRSLVEDGDTRSPPFHSPAPAHNAFFRENDCSGTQSGRFVPDGVVHLCTL